MKQQRSNLLDYVVGYLLLVLSLSQYVQFFAEELALYKWATYTAGACR
jgi:hypothetical protein